MRKFILVVFGLALGPLLEAETHDYRPERYALHFSAADKPVLRLRAGDTVRTTLVDSEGNDADGKRAGPKYNALTGPFYVEGVKPGDTLVVQLQEVRLNSRTGFASTRLSEFAITPREFAKGAAGVKGFFWTTDQPISPREFVANSRGGRGYVWTYDLETMTGSTDITPRLSQLRLPLRPFPGCVGVAPPLEESISSRFAGDHGGNLDYNQLVEGTTLYFPVYVEGGLFYLGDGHAAQGDGEPSGGAVETTLAVKFLVDSVPRQQIPSVRAESDEYYIALGVADPLDRAYQRATENMVHWLTQGFGFAREEANVIIGTLAKYDIASAVNERGKSVACKIPKALLRPMLQETGR